MISGGDEYGNSNLFQSVSQRVQAFRRISAIEHIARQQQKIAPMGSAQSDKRSGNVQQRLFQKCPLGIGISRQRGIQMHIGTVQQLNQANPPFLPVYIIR